MKEILKLDNFQAEHELFKARCATKACKRELNIKGDEYLFFPHKKKKIVRTEDEEEKKRERRSKTKNLHSSNNKHYSNSSNNHHNHHNKHHQNKMVHQQASLMSNSTRKSSRYGSCYSFVGIKEKNETIKRAVLENCARERNTTRDLSI